jgi:N-succinyldiaminopimelate aminotransferase
VRPAGESRTAARLLPFGSSIFGEMSRLAAERSAINLSQGFPDFDGPPGILEAAHRAMREGHNQYARSQGHPLLVEAIARKVKRRYGIEYDPLKEVIVFSGATEGIASAILGLLEPGDEVILIEPFYDSYPACVAMAGGTVRCLTLRFPGFEVDLAGLEALVGPRTRLLILNTPHNPTGKVYTRAELEGIAALCRKHDVLVLSDEVYEHITYAPAEHLPIASLPGMRDRTLTLSSTGKTFSLTGWKIGWGTGPEPLVRAAQAAHQFVTFATSTPFQVAMARAIDEYDGEFLDDLLREYTERRDFLAGVLEKAGLRVALPRGTYFILADFTAIFEGDDVAFARSLVETRGVAAIPPSGFYSAAKEEGRKLIRFAFSKRMETLRAAGERLLRRS